MKRISDRRAGGDFASCGLESLKKLLKFKTRRRAKLRELRVNFSAKRHKKCRVLKFLSNKYYQQMNGI